MAGKNKKKAGAPSNVAAQNRKARHNYAIEDTLEAGIVLMGSEVKSLRNGSANIAECYAQDKDGELFLFNAHIPEYKAARTFGHEPRRPRKLLVKKRELAKLLAAVQRDGMTIVALKIYFNDRGIAKVQLGLGKGKKKQDKRADIKERDWKRQKARIMRSG